MTALARAGWLLSAALAAAIAGSLVHVHFTGYTPWTLVAALAALSVVRPRWGFVCLGGIVPIAWYSASHYWNAGVAWPEAAACAALAGLGADAAVRHRDRVPRAAAVPAAIFGAIVLAAFAAGQYVDAVREGPAYWPRIAGLLTHDILIDRYARGVHAALLLVEGLLLFAHGARLCAPTAMLRRVAGAAGIGCAAAACATLLRLVQAAGRGTSFWPSFVELAGRLRWNVHYDDFNAAGSVYAMALLAACGVAWTASRRGRALWIAVALVVAVGLWLTSSRIAILAVPLAAAVALLAPRAAAGRRQALGAAAIGLAAAALLALLAVVLPQRGIQHSSLLAADIRVGLIETGARMIRAYPAFGIGLGAFQPRSAEFSSPELIAKFPVVAQHGENAHNNFVQVAAETGVAGGLAFAWTIAVALFAVARGAAAGDRLHQAVFAALLAFCVTMTAGHPLLVPEAVYAFWILAGAAAAALPPAQAAAPHRRWTYAVAAALTVIVLTLPLRLGAAMRDAPLEHIGIGVSPIWLTSPDDRRYREAIGQATLFEPPGAFKLSINPRTSESVRLEISLDGRVADIITLEPSRWNDIVIPARNVQTDGRFRRMDLRTLDGANPTLWITKDEPILSR